MKRLSMDDVTNILTDYGKPEAPHGLPFVRFRPTGPGTNGQTYIIEATTDYGSFRVYATFDEDGSRTNFSADVGAPSRWESVAKVNWPSIGARTADEARLFAKVLYLAANIAAAVTDALAAKEGDA
jgi:hypothetical protein